MVSMALESTIAALTDVMLKQRRAWRHAQPEQNWCQMQIFLVFASSCLTACERLLQPSEFMMQSGIVLLMKMDSGREGGVLT